MTWESLAPESQSSETESGSENTSRPSLAGRMLTVVVLLTLFAACAQLFLLGFNIDLSQIPQGSAFS